MRTDLVVQSARYVAVGWTVTLVPTAAVGGVSSQVVVTVFDSTQ